MVGNEGLNRSDSIEFYTEKARHGESEAYLKLAECYHLSEMGLEQRIIKMALMGTMAEMYGATPSFRTVFESLEDGDSVRMVYDITKMVGEHQYNEALAKGRDLECDAVPYELVEGFIAMEKNQMEEAMKKFMALKGKGNKIACIFVAILQHDMETMSVAAEAFPWLYNEMARMNIEQGESSESQIRVAEKYYRMADEQACLDREGVHFMLRYGVSQKEGRQIDTAEVARWKAIAKTFNE